MKRAITFLLTFHLSLLLLQPAFSQDSSPVFKTSDTQAITAKLGQKITVKGIVSEVRKTSSGTNFINFENSDFYLVTFKSDLAAFEKGEPADLYQGKHLAVTGVVSTYKGKPQMKLTQPDMVKFVTADAASPPTQKKPNKQTQKSEAKTSTSESKTKPPKKDLPKKTVPVDAKKYFK